MKMLKSKKAKITLISTLFALAILFSACFIYLGSYYRADEEAVNAFLPSAEETRVDGNLIFKPENVNYGLIFYPGGKVDEKAYIPLMREISSHGVLCILVKMPFRLAVFDINAADGIKETYPEVTDWYIGGHSLGGSMAAAYLENEAEDFQGLVLLGSYSTADLSKTELRVLSIFGDCDEVMNKEKYKASVTNMPNDFTETVILGGCHAYFGTYGEQKGDGEASITNEEQIKATAETFAAWLER